MNRAVIDTKIVHRALRSIQVDVGSWGKHGSLGRGIETVEGG